MKEAGLVIDLNGRVIYQHLPEGRSSGYLPDSRTLWEVLWENRQNLLGFAHSHSGYGVPSPSFEDITTFRPVDQALGRDLHWWIATGDRVLLYRWGGLQYVSFPMLSEPPWVADLRDLSGHFQRDVV